MGIGEIYFLAHGHWAAKVCSPSYCILRDAGIRTHTNAWIKSYGIASLQTGWFSHMFKAVSLTHIFGVKNQLLFDQNLNISLFIEKIFAKTFHPEPGTNRNNNLYILS